MARAIPTEEFEIIQRVAQLGQSGLNAVEVADALGKPVTSLRYVLEKHGMEMVSAVQVRAKIGGQTLAELIRTGVVEEAPEREKAAA